jgi:serine protease
MLAACGGGNSGTIPSQTQSLPAHTNSMQSVHSTAGTGTFVRVNDDGSVVHYFPTRQEMARVGQPGLRPPSAQSLVYGGGPIQNHPKVYVVFWGSLWNNGGDPQHTRPVLKKFLGGLNGSQWTSTMTQYYGPVGTYINNTTALAGTYVDTAHQPPTTPSDSQIAAEALVAAAHFHNYTKNASYVVAMPHGHNPSGFGTQYCAYHNDESGPGGIIAYTNLPYMPDAGFSCGAGSVNSPGTDDGVSIVEGHEQAETETDPQPVTGWYNNSYGEIGDECAWQNLQNTMFSTGTFPTQPLWSNSNNACVQ